MENGRSDQGLIVTLAATIVYSPNVAKVDPETLIPLLARCAGLIRAQLGWSSDQVHEALRESELNGHAYYAALVGINLAKDPDDHWDEGRRAYASRMAAADIESYRLERGGSLNEAMERVEAVLRIWSPSTSDRERVPHAIEESAAKGADSERTKELKGYLNVTPAPLCRLLELSPRPRCDVQRMIDVIAPVLSEHQTEAGLWATLEAAAAWCDIFDMSLEGFGDTACHAAPPRRGVA